MKVYQQQNKDNQFVDSKLTNELIIANDNMSRFNQRKYNKSPFIYDSLSFQTKLKDRKVSFQVKGDRQFGLKDQLVRKRGNKKHNFSLDSRTWENIEINWRPHTSINI